MILLPSGICSYLDIVDKEDGRDIAEDRAIKAIKLKTSTEEINRGDIIQMECDIAPGIYHEYKSNYNIEITEFEKQLFTPEVFTEDILKSLEPIIYKYFDYSSYDEHKFYMDKMDEDGENLDADFDEIDNEELFKDN